MTDNLFKCPNCAELIQSDAILCRFCQQGLSTDHFIGCPRCAEMVRKDASSCRFCGAGTRAAAAINPRPAHAPTVSAAVIVDTILEQLRESFSCESILNRALEAAAETLHCDRAVIWQVIGDRLVATNEYAHSEHRCFSGNNFEVQESTAIVLEFLSSFPDESGSGVLAIADTRQDKRLQDVSPTLVSLIELADVRSRLVLQLRCRGVLYGFFELQVCASPRSWNAQDASVAEPIAKALSFVVQQAHDSIRIEMDAKDVKFICSTLSLFRDFNDADASHDVIVKSVKGMAEHLGFVHAQVYLLEESDKMLSPQIQEEDNSKLNLESPNNPFVAVFESGRGKVINAEHTRKGDPYFKHDTALIFPLVSEGRRLGVVGLWSRDRSQSSFRPQDRELWLAISIALAQFIHIQKLK